MAGPVWSVRLWRILLVVGAVVVLAAVIESGLHLRSLAGRPEPEDLSNAAEGMTRLVEAYVDRTIAITGMIANSPTVSDALEVASRVARDDGKVSSADRLWATSPGGVDDPYRGIEKAAASVFLGDVTRAPGSPYREILIADRAGRLVAASNRTEDYDQRDDAWWPLDLDHMPGICRYAVAKCVSLEDVTLDQSAGAYGFSVHVPTFSRKPEPVGVLKAVVDPTELMSLIELTQTQPGTRVALINGSGKAVFGGQTLLPDASDALQELATGAERMIPLGPTPEAGIAYVRRLSGPMGKAWYVTAQSIAPPPARRWQPFLVWPALALGMFVIALLAVWGHGDEAARPTGIERAA